MSLIKALTLQSSQLAITHLSRDCKHILYDSLQGTQHLLVMAAANRWWLVNNMEQNPTLTSHKLNRHIRMYSG